MYCKLCLDIYGTKEYKRRKQKSTQVNKSMNRKGLYKIYKFMCEKHVQEF